MEYMAVMGTSLEIKHGCWEVDFLLVYCREKIAHHIRDFPLVFHNRILIGAQNEVSMTIGILSEEREVLKFGPVVIYLGSVQHDQVINYSLVSINQGTIRYELSCYFFSKGLVCELEFLYKS